MTRIDRVFKQLKAKGEKALIPFITAGDPDLATTRALALEMAARGADILELGVPFSDPLADGPTIQAASLRAMQGGVHLVDVLKLVGDFRAHTQIPIILMGYYNPMLQYGLERTATEAAAQGVDGFIIPDLPPEEAGPWRVEAAKAKIATIFLAAPTSGPERIKTPGAPHQGVSLLRLGDGDHRGPHRAAPGPGGVAAGGALPGEMSPGRGFRHLHPGAGGRTGPLRGRGGGGQRHRPAGGATPRPGTGQGGGRLHCRAQGAPAGEVTAAGTQKIL